MANRYWVGGTATWDATAGTKWATTSGGAGGAAVPTSADDVFFDGSSGSGTVTVSTATCLSITLTGYTGTLSGNGTMNVYGNYTNSATATHTRTGPTNFLSTSTGRTITMAGDNIGSNVTFNDAGGGWTLQDAFTCTGSLTLTTGILDTNGVAVSCANLVSSSTSTRTLTLGASTVTITGNATFGSTNLTFNANTSTIAFTAGNSTFDPASQTFYAITSSVSGTLSTTNSFTCTNLTITCATGQRGNWVVGGNSNTITGTFTVNVPTTTDRFQISSDTAGTSRTITAAAVSLTRVNFLDITAAGAASPFTGTALGNCGNVTNITTATPVTRYAVSPGDLNSTATWSTTSGGASGASIPLPQDTLIFDANSGSGTYNVTGPIKSMGTVNCTGFTGTYNVALVPDYFGSLILSSTMTYTGSALNVSLGGRGAFTLTSAGQTLGSTMQTRNVGYTYTMSDDLTITGAITLFGGGLDTGNNDISCSAVVVGAGTARSLTLGSGTVTLTGTGTVWNVSTSASATINAGTSTIVLSDDTTSARTFVGGNKTYYNLVIGGSTSTSTLTISNSNTFNDLQSTKTTAYTVLFTAGTNNTFANFSLDGTSGNVLTIGSPTASAHTLTKSGGGTVIVNYASISYSTASPASTWIAKNSTNAGNNTNWIFSVDITVPVTGVQGTSALGSVTVDSKTNAIVTGVQGTTALGTETVIGTSITSITGVEGTGEVGTVYVYAPITVTGVQADGSVGDVFVVGNSIADITGVEGTTQLGTPTVYNENRYNVSGVQATGQVGTASVITDAIIVLVSGVSGTGQVGRVAIWSLIDDAQDPNWVVIST